MNAEEKIRGRVRKLLSLSSNNPSAAEAASAYAMAMAMVEAYGIDIKDVESWELEDKPQAPRLSGKTKSVVISERRVKWVSIVCDAAAGLHGGDGGYARGRGSVVWGPEEIIDSVRDTFERMIEALERSVSSSPFTSRTERHSYRTGYALALRDKVNELSKDMRDDISQDIGSSEGGEVALARIDQFMSRRAMAIEVTKIAMEGVKRTTTEVRARSRRAYEAGQTAGNAARLMREME